jgi:hypothetical protein
MSRLADVGDSFDLLKASYDLAPAFGRASVMHSVHVSTDTTWTTATLISENVEVSGRVHKCERTGVHSHTPVSACTGAQPRAWCPLMYVPGFAIGMPHKARLVPHHRRLTVLPQKNAPLVIWLVTWLGTELIIWLVTLVPVQNAVTIKEAMSGVMLGNASPWEN